MKLKWPLWAIVTVWLILHGIAFFSFPFGSPINITGLGFIPAILIYGIYGAFTQSVGYGVIVGKKTFEAWKTESADKSKDKEGSSLTGGYLAWLIAPLIIYIPFLLIAISER